MTMITERTGAVNGIVGTTILTIVLPLLGALCGIIFTVVGFLMCYYRKIFKRKSHTVTPSNTRVNNISEEQSSLVEVDSHVEKNVFVRVINLENRSDDEIVRQSKLPKANVPGKHSYENEQQSKDSGRSMQIAASRVTQSILQAKDEDKHSMPAKDEKKQQTVSPKVTDEHALTVYARQAVPTEEYSLMPKELSNLHSSENTALVQTKLVLNCEEIERLPHIDSDEEDNAAMLEPHEYNILMDDRVSACQQCSYT